MKYFTIDELCKSDTAFLHNIDNTPKDPKIYDNLEALVDNCLDVAREQLCEPIIVNCAYRCPEVNRLVGGVKTSAHLRGAAADIRCKNMTKLINILKHLPAFDQLIVYQTFCHISYETERPNRKQIIYK